MNCGLRISDFPDLYSKPDEEFPISDFPGLYSKPFRRDKKSEILFPQSAIPFALLVRRAARRNWRQSYLRSAIARTARDRRVLCQGI